MSRGFAITCLTKTTVLLQKQYISNLSTETPHSALRTLGEVHHDKHRQHKHTHKQQMPAKGRGRSYKLQGGTFLDPSRTSNYYIHTRQIQAPQEWAGMVIVCTVACSSPPDSDKITGRTRTSCLEMSTLRPKRTRTYNLHALN